MTKPVLATGAGGFVGGHVARTLAARGWRVVGVDHRAGYSEPNGDGSMTRLEVDFASDEILDAVAAGWFAAVVHHAAIVDTTRQDADSMLAENATKALRLAAAAYSSRTPFAYASSASVYGRTAAGSRVREENVDDPLVCSGPLNAYATSKLTLDKRMVDAYGATDWVWAGLRYTNVFGEGESRKGAMKSMLHKLMERTAIGERVVLFDDTLFASRDYVPVEAIAERMAAMLRRGSIRSGVYNAGSGIAVSFSTLLQWCAECSGRPPLVELVPNPYASAYQYWTCVDMTRWATELDDDIALTEADIQRHATDLYSSIVRREREPSAVR